MMMVPNLNVRPGDYKEMSQVPRPGHADYTYQMKYGTRASSGGGRSSARETIGRVAAGAVAEKLLESSLRSNPTLSCAITTSRTPSSSPRRWWWPR
jgi:chorismate synthase